MNEIDIKIKLYGILSVYAQGEETLQVNIPAEATIFKISQILYNRICEYNKQLTPEKMQELKQIIESSAFAKEDQILDESHQLVQFQQNDLVSVLPPVCGG
jgi:hypothetical protein